MEPPDAIDKALDAGLKAVNLYETAESDVIRREDLRDFLNAALTAWLIATDEQRMHDHAHRIKKES